MSIVIYANGHRPPDQFARTYVPVMSDLDYARSWMAHFLKGQAWSRDGNKLTLESGITLRTDRLDDLLPVKDPPTELRPDDHQNILRFKYGTWDEVHAKPEPESDGEMKSSPRPERSARAQRPDGYVTITELCAASGVPACDARALLRASGREKPSYGWAFAPSEIPAIKKLCGIG